MLYFVTDHPTITNDIHDPIVVYFVTGDHDAAVKFRDGTFVLDRHSIKTEEQAKLLAAACNVMAVKGGNPYEWVDQGSNHWPRYDVVMAPQVGDEVSYSFNGDTYPCGKITSISAFYHPHEGKVSRRRIVATEDDGSTHTFNRLRNTGSWKKDRTWSLVSGHRNERNPSF